ncbi:MAG: YncE family protein, partial [Blastocatellia bacterium]
SSTLISPRFSVLPATFLQATDGTVLGTFTVGRGPAWLTFDGANAWVTNQMDNNVMNLRARDGSVLGTYSVGTTPGEVVFDGASIWVTNNLTNPRGNQAGRW